MELFFAALRCAVSTRVQHVIFCPRRRGVSPFQWSKKTLVSMRSDLTEFKSYCVFACATCKRVNTAAVSDLDGKASRLTAEN